MFRKKIFYFANKNNLFQVNTKLSSAAITFNNILGTLLLFKFVCLLKTTVQKKYPRFIERKYFYTSHKCSLKVIAVHVYSTNRALHFAPRTRM